MSLSNRSGLLTPVSAVLLLLFGMHAWFVALNLPFSEIGTDRPLFYIDGPYHWYEMELAKAFASTGNMVGYDPFFSAGHPEGVIYNLSGKLPAVLAVLLSPWISTVSVYKTYVFSLATLAPIAIPLAAALLRFPPITFLWTAALGILMWWVSYFHWYFTAGMVAYVTACYLGVLFVALVIRYAEGWGSPATAVGLGLLGAFGLFLHPVFPIPVAIATAAYLAINVRRLEMHRMLLVASVIPIVSLLPNLIWLYPTYRYQQLYPVDSIPAYQQIVDGRLIWRELLGILKDEAHGSKLYPMFVAASVWACLSQSGEYKTRHLSIVFLLSAVALQLLAYLGATIPGVGLVLQPNRLAPAGYLLLCLPAAEGLRLLWITCRSRARGRWRYFAGVNLLAMVLALAVVSWELYREVTPGPHGRYGAAPPWVRPLGSDSLWVLNWLMNKTGPQARVLFETSLGRVHDQAHMAPYYALTSRREFIGGPYPFTDFASFWDGWLFGKPIAEISGEGMERYLDLYNVGWIIVHSEHAKRYFDKLPNVRAEEQHGQLRAYSVQRRHSYFVEGTGQVESRGHNQLSLSGLAGKDVILKYHYVPGMASEPAAHIEGVKILDDPKSFIRIVDPPSRLRLYLP